MLPSALSTGRTKRVHASLLLRSALVCGVGRLRKIGRESSVPLPPLLAMVLIYIDTRHARPDLNNPSITLLLELKRIGFHGDVPCSYDSNPLSAHFEVHIEQGPVLQAENLPVAVVTGAQGMSLPHFIVSTVSRIIQRSPGSL